MKATDRYHKWIEWSEEDRVYIGKCPDLITGIHGDNPVEVYAELCHVVEDVIHDFEARERIGGCAGAGDRGPLGQREQGGKGKT